MKRAAVPSILVVVVLLAVAVIAEAQQPKKIPRIGYLTNAPLSVISTNRDVSAKDCGSWVTSKAKTSFSSAARGEQSRERQRAMAAELVRLKVDIIVAGGSGDIRAAKEATSTIPIVMVNSGDRSCKRFRRQPRTAWR